MSASALELPAGVRRLLLFMAADGFVLHCCGPRDAPAALVASYDWQLYVDLVTIRDFARITTARVPRRVGVRVDVFAPEVVVWAYEGDPQPALWALLNLPHPDHPDAPVGAYVAPRSLRIPPDERRPMTIRVPPPGRRGARAARLGARLPGAAR